MPIINSATQFTRRNALSLLGLGAAATAMPQFASGAAPSFPKGSVIRTVLKDYAPEDLAGGATLFHEHMSFATDFMTRWAQYSRDARQTNLIGAPKNPNAPAPGAGRAGAAPPQAPPVPTGPYFTLDSDLMTEEMKAARGDGIACLVDGGHPDMGRDINFLKKISQQSGLPIVAGGGFYSQPYYPKEIATMTEDQIVATIVKQTEDDPIGVFGEIGSWDNMTKDERKVFRAIGRAQVLTGLSIFTHTGIPGKAALEQLDIFEDQGVNPNRVVIGHLGNLVDPVFDVHRAICRRGAFIGFDRQGGPGDAQQVPIVMGLIEAGYADQLMFASDLSAPAQLKKNNGAGYAKTLTVFVPKLKAAGASDEVLRGIMVDNPRRFLAFVPKKPRPA